MVALQRRGTEKGGFAPGWVMRADHGAVLPPVKSAATAPAKAGAQAAIKEGAGRDDNISALDACAPRKIAAAPAILPCCIQIFFGGWCS